MTGMTNREPSMVESVRRAADLAAERTAEYLATPAGRRLRRGLAAAMVVTAPAVFRSKALRKYPLIRLLDLLGGSAALIALARMIREWEPAEAERAATSEVTVGAAGGPGSNGHRASP